MKHCKACGQTISPEWQAYRRTLKVANAHASVRKAKERGTKLGRKLALTKEQAQEARARLSIKESLRSVAKHFGVAPGTITRAVKLLG